MGQKKSSYHNEKLKCVILEDINLGSEDSTLTGHLRTYLEHKGWY